MHLGVPVQKEWIFTIASTETTEVDVSAFLSSFGSFFWSQLVHNFRMDDGQLEENIATVPQHFVLDAICEVCYDTGDSPGS